MYVLFVCVQALRVAMTGHEYSRRPREGRCPRLGSRPMRSDAVGRAVDWRRRDALLLEHDAELDVRSVGEDSGSRDRARVVCEVRRVVDATVFGAVAAVLLVGGAGGVTQRAGCVAADGLFVLPGTSVCIPALRVAIKCM